MTAAWKGTPGPWQVDGSHVYGPDPQRHLVCQVVSDGGRLIGDRNVIAAVPQLIGSILALGAMPDGWCACSSNRVGDDSKVHQPECADVREALLAAGVEV